MILVLNKVLDGFAHDVEREVTLAWHGHLHLYHSWIIITNPYEHDNK